MPADLIGVLLLMRSEYFTQSQQTTFCSSLWSRVLSGGGRGVPLSPVTDPVPSPDGGGGYKAGTGHRLPLPGGSRRHGRTVRLLQSRWRTFLLNDTNNGAFDGICQIITVKNHRF